MPPSTPLSWIVTTWSPSVVTTWTRSSRTPPAAVPQYCHRDAVPGTPKPSRLHRSPSAGRRSARRRWRGHARGPAGAPLVESVHTIESSVKPRADASGPRRGRRSLSVERGRPEVVGVALGVGVLGLAVRARGPAALGEAGPAWRARGRRAGRPGGDAARELRGRPGQVGGGPLRVSRSNTWARACRAAAAVSGTSRSAPSSQGPDRSCPSAGRAASPSRPCRVHQGQARESWSDRGPSRNRIRPSSVTPSKYCPLSASRSSLVYDASTRSSGPPRPARRRPGRAGPSAPAGPRGAAGRGARRRSQVTRRPRRHRPRAPRRPTSGARSATRRRPAPTTSPEVEVVRRWPATFSRISLLQVVHHESSSLRPRRARRGTRPRTWPAGRQRARGLALDGALAAAERGGGLADVELLEVAQHHARPLPLRQPRERRHQRGPVGDVGRDVLAGGAVGSLPTRVARCSSACGLGRGRR